MDKMCSNAGFDDTLSEEGSTPSLSEERQIRFTDIPVEVLEVVLSYLPIASPAGLDGRCGIGLLGSSGRSMTQVSRFLRKTVIEYIHKNILWVHLICHTSTAYPRIQWLFEGEGLEPDPFREALPDSDLPGLYLEFGDMRTQGLQEYDSAIVPSDFRWIARMVGSLLGATYDVEFLTIRQDPLPSRQLEQLIIEQIHSLVPIIHHDVYVSVIEVSSAQTIWSYSFRQYESEDDRQRDLAACAFPRADALTIVLRDLDRCGLEAEGTLLCMYYYYQRFIIDRPDPPDFGHRYSTLGMGQLEAWAGDGGVLNRDDWETNSDNLERVRRIRTLHYLKFRACKGYIQNFRKHGWDFIASNYQWICGLERSSPDAKTLFSYHFDDSFGLLDYEIAELYYILSIFQKFRADVLHADVRPKHFMLIPEHHDFDLSLAFRWAFYAWSCDIKNSFYMGWLTELRAVMSSSLIDSETKWLRQKMAERVQPYFGGYPDLWRDWEDRGGINYVSWIRARHLAREVDLYFDNRRGHDLPRDYDPQSDLRRQERFLALRAQNIPSDVGVSS